MAEKNLLIYRDGSYLQTHPVKKVEPLEGGKRIEVFPEHGGSRKLDVPYADYQLAQKHRMGKDPVITDITPTMIRRYKTASIVAENPSPVTRQDGQTPS